MDANTVKYGKSIALTMSDGTIKTFTGTAALGFQQMLENNPRIKDVLTPETGVVTYYNLSDSGCGFCKVAVVTPSAAATTPASCEDGMPNCPNDTLNPTTPSLKLSAQLVQVEVGGTATITAEAVPANAVLTWTSAATATATVANGVVTGVKAGNTVVTVTAKDSSEENAKTLATATATVQVFPTGTFTNPITGGSAANK